MFLYGRDMEHKEEKQVSERFESMDGKVFRNVRKELEKVLKEKRYEHTLGVEFTAASLAMRYGEDVEKLQMAGLLHDCAKGFSNEEQIEQCEKYDLPISDVERENPGLLHARLGAYLAKKKYHVEDPEILSAIEWHTTGRPEMTMAEKILYVADYIEPGRRDAPALTGKRIMAFRDLDQALLWILEDTVLYLKERALACDPMTEKTYEYYASRVKAEREEWARADRR